MHAKKLRKQEILIAGGNGESGEIVV